MLKERHYLITNSRPSQAEKAPEPPAILPLVQFAFSTLGRLFPGFAANIAYRLFTTPQKRARHSVSDPVLEAAKVFEFLYAKSMLKGYEWGYGKKTVLLIHGWESRGTALRSFVKPLTALGYRVVAFDGPAHGDSEGSRLNLVIFAGAVKAIINRIGGVDAAITHSFGGASIAYAMQQIDPSIRMQRLVMIAVPSDMEAVFNEAVEKLCIPKNAARRFKSKLEAKAGAPLATLSLPRLGKNIHIDKTLVIHDENDQVVPFKFAEKIAEAWPDTTLLVTKNLGHFKLIKNPDLVAYVTNFIHEEDRKKMQAE